MTAIVGVLNKHAVAMAADSAVTLGGGRKVHNGANKLFSLSKRHPVAVAVYGSSEFVGTPWEIIIKKFRKELADNSYATLKEYVDGFLDFVKRNNNFCNDKESLDYLKANITLTVKNIIGYCSKDKNLVTDFLRNVESRITSPFIDGFDDGTITYINSAADAELNQASDFLLHNSNGFDMNRIRTILIAIFTRKIQMPVPVAIVSGLVFTGYGEEEIFPSLYHFEISNVINDVPAIVFHRPSIITKKDPSDIRPFAQTDVMTTVLDGVAPQIQGIYMDSLMQTFNTITGQLAGIIAPSDPVLANKVQSLDIEPFGRMFNTLSRQAQISKYTRPFVNSIAGLEKEDLAEFAESLITLTSLKRKVSPDQETVGGPVDVMVISKGDGIIWMKRKHYFDANKNHHFFSNYYNS